MDVARDSLVFLHLIGMAALFGGLFVQLRTAPRVVNSAMVHGTLTQLVTGLLLVGLLEADDAEVNHVKVGLKLMVALAIGALLLVHRGKDALAARAFFGLLGLTVLNVAVAVFW